ncbi:MAG: PepSY-associated TM helix domain-containing protein [Bacteroidales bacterium]|nr:PepSY-associated TM helix domain-containing protein [Bacteroidales bacterium]
MKLQWRKWFRVVHRDFGYLFFGLTLIYSISGIALNHINEWNSNFIIVRKEITIENPEKIRRDMTKDDARELLEPFEEQKRYKNHYFPSGNQMKIFLEGGSVIINTETGNGLLERVSRRPFFREMNYLHYNPEKSWTWISDVFAGALIVLAITGLFLVRGAKGITKRGAWLTILGIILPVIFLLIYFY